MAAWRRSIELSLGDADTAKLRSIAQSRTEPANRVEWARILLAYREDPSLFAVGRALGLHHQTVQRCVERAVAEGPMAALDDRPRPGREPTITLRPRRGWCRWRAGSEGPRLSPRTVDDPASRPPRSRARTVGGQPSAICRQGNEARMTDSASRGSRQGWARFSGERAIPARRGLRRISGGCRRDGPRRLATIGPPPS
jgi:Winged helix-turn helix